MNLQIEPPEKKKKNRTSPPPTPPSCPSFSLFPDEIFVNCLARISRMYYPTLSIISKSFRSLLSSTELYAARSHIGTTEQCLYVCLSDESYQSPQWFTLCINPNRTLTVSTIKKKKTVGKSLAPIPSSSDFPSTELSMPKCTRPSSAVRILDCRTHTWRDALSMIVPGTMLSHDAENWKSHGLRCSKQIHKLGNLSRTQLYLLHNKEIKGKIFFWNPNRAYAYDTSQDKWESYAGLWESTTCLIDGGVHYAPYHFRWTKDGGDWEVMKGVSSCIVSLLPFDGLVSELEKREEEEANGEQQELRRRIREPMSIWDGLPRMQIPMFTELIAMVLKEISMRLLAQTTPGTIQEVIAAMNLQVEPPEKKSKRKKKTSPSPSTSPSFSLLPDEIIVSCLALISRAYYPRLSIISKSFRSLLSSKQLYTARSHIGSTEQCLYVCLSDERYQSPQWFTRWINPNLALEKKKKKKTLGKSLAPIPSSDSPSISKSTVVVGSDIYVIGGPIKTEPSCPSSAIRILDCRTHTWLDAPSMIVARNDSLTCFYDGKIYVMGGCGDDDEPWAESVAYDTSQDYGEYYYGVMIPIALQEKTAY
ncbi:hypothetical protein HID58_093668 [Brassica napus]|uniref:F-box domain-containing protein n=1 Tax=Brassica napus TaxID=3708 RepID=A0ABQ7XA62_BRANA|nr:hypothetical protein HID58_093668 [Brassica napus]